MGVKSLQNAMHVFHPPYHLKSMDGSCSQALADQVLAIHVITYPKPEPVRQFAYLQTLFSQVHVEGTSHLLGRIV